MRGRTAAVLWNVASKICSKQHVTFLCHLHPDLYPCVSLASIKVYCHSHGLKESIIISIFFSEKENSHYLNRETKKPLRHNYPTPVCHWITIFEGGECYIIHTSVQQWKPRDVIWWMWSKVNQSKGGSTMSFSSPDVGYKNLIGQRPESNSSARKLQLYIY